MSVPDYKINYKSDFVLTINGDAGWAVPFCIKFWTGMPSQAYFVGFNGVKYVNCRVGDTPTQLLVMFDDHHLPIGKLMMQIAYHTTIEEFPGSVFDEVTNASDVIVTIDGTDYQVMLDFTGEDTPELEFNLPAYANEAERIQNELQRQQNEAARIEAELQREQATAAAVQGAENVNAQLSGTTLTVTNRQGVSTSVNTKGEQGEQGPVGPEGPQGQKGVSVTGLVKTGETDTDTLYNVTFSDGTTQAVAIPKGAKGDTGATGPTGPQGPQGQTGVSITGLVKTGETETDTLYNVTFSNGTTQAVSIPKGEKGDQGEQGPQGPQGPMGDVAVITPEQQAAFTMYSVPGNHTDGPMTQKAVTDSLVSETISYDNSESGIAADNVQGALDSLSPLLGTDTTAFSLTGNDNTLVYRTFVLEAGKKYIIKTDMVAADYNSTKIFDGINVYSVTPYINGAYGTVVFATRKGIDTPPQEYSFVAVEAEYYSVGIRANKNKVVSLWLEEVDLIIDNKPTVGSNGLVRSGGVYDFVSSLNPHSFILTGAGATIVNEVFKLEAGEEYTVEVDMSTFLYSNIAETNIYSVYYFKGAKSFPVFYTMKGTDEVIAKHTFTAVEADYYSVAIRANEGAEVKLYLYKSSGIPVDETPKLHSPNVVRSSGLYKMQTLNRELSLNSMSCAWVNDGKTRYRCAIRVPYIPAYVKVNNKPDGYYVSIQSNLTLSDALSVFVNPVQNSAWNELEYTFDDNSAHYICLNIRNLTNTTMTDSDIENFSQMRITLYPWIAASDGGDDIISLNNEAETKCYLESANLQDHGWSGSSYTTKTKPVVLLHFSDLHGNAENLKRIVEFKNHYSDYINDAIGSGDLVRDTLADDWTFWNAAGAEDILQATGNHEYYVSAPNYSWATTQQVYNKFFGNIENWGVTGHPSGTCYYYKDYAEQNLRLIVLDSLINDAAQTTWLQGLLNDVLANHQTYHVLFVAHTAPFNKTGIPCPLQTLSDWDAWFAWRDYMDTIAGIVDTFITNGGKFVGWLCGHTHRDFFCKLTDHPNQLFVSVGCATDMSDWAALRNGTDMFRESYTKSMDLFNIVTIDTANSRLKLKRIGADIDRDLRKKVALVYDYENREIIYTE